jgi:hypothetical protein
MRIDQVMQLRLRDYVTGQAPLYLAICLCFPLVFAPPTNPPGPVKHGRRTLLDIQNLNE